MYCSESDLDHNWSNKYTRSEHDTLSTNLTSGVFRHPHIGTYQHEINKKKVKYMPTLNKTEQLQLLIGTHVNVQQNLPLKSCRTKPFL